MEPRILILLGVTLVWGTTFPLLKALSADLSGLEISAVRFAFAALLTAPWWMRAPRGVWRDGAVLGGLALAAYATQASGVRYISANRSAFLTGLHVLLVPLLGVFLFRRRPPWVVWPAAALACLGLGLLTWEGGAHPTGDGLTLVCALANALYVIELSRRAGRHEARALAAAQIAVMAVAAAAGAVVVAGGSGTLATLPARAAAHPASLAYLGVIATAGMLMLQAYAQQRVAAERAALVFALEPVFAAGFAAWWLQERLGARGLAGGALIVLAMVMSEWRPRGAARGGRLPPAGGPV